MRYQCILEKELLFIGHLHVYRVYHIPMLRCADSIHVREHGRKGEHRHDMFGFNVYLKIQKIDRPKQLCALCILYLEDPTVLEKARKHELFKNHRKHVFCISMEAIEHSKKTNAM